MEEKEVMSKDVFDYLQQKCPMLLHSYMVLSKFYEHMTNDYTHKVWKDGRLVLTPRPKEDEQKVSTEQPA